MFKMFYNVQLSILGHQAKCDLNKMAKQFYVSTIQKPKQYPQVIIQTKHLIKGLTDL